MSDLVERLLAAIDETEREARDRVGVFPSPEVHDNGAVWLQIGSGGNCVVVHYGHPVEGHGDMATLRKWAAAERGQTQEAVLRRCAADRRTVESYRKTCEIRDEIRRRGLPGWQLPPADLGTWDRADREASIMEEGVRNLADGYGITETTAAS